MSAAQVKAQSVKAATSAKMTSTRDKATKSVRAKARGAAKNDSSEFRFTNPDRVYWKDAGITKKDLADYYQAIWKHMEPHVVRRPMALVRCPEGVGSECFFQKHAAAGLVDPRIRRIKDKKGEELIYIEDLDGMMQLVQAGVLEVHLWGSTVDDIESCNRMVFDLDPGDGVAWADMIYAARELRERLQALKLESFLKTTGGKGLHVVVPFAGADWDTTKSFTHAMVQMMEADDPKRYVSKMTKSLRKGRIFMDYLRNGRGATAIAAYSTRARPGATMSMPITWDELTAKMSPNKFTVMNAEQRLARLKKDPWADIERVGKKQKLPAAAFGGKRRT